MPIGRTFCFRYPFVLFAFMLLTTEARAQSGWTGTVRTLSPAGERATDALHAVADDGDGIVVWVTSGIGPMVRGARFDAATRQWTSPVTIAALAIVATDLHLASDAAGNAVAVWRLATGGVTSQVQYARYFAASDTWGVATNLPGASSGLYPEMIIDGAGNITAIWTEEIFPNFFLKSSRFNASTNSWSVVRDIAMLGNGASGSDRSMVVDADGNVTLAWRGGTTNPDTFQIHAARYSAASNTWSAPTLLASGPGFGDDPRLGIDGAGNVTGIWQSPSGSSRNLQIARYDRAMNSWGSPTIIPGSTTADSDRFVVDASGNVALMWEIVFVSDDRIQVARYNAASGAWSAPATLSQEGQDADTGDVAIDPFGNIIAVWNRFNGTEEVAQAARFNPATNTWGPTTDLGLMGDDGEDVAVVVDPRGNAIVIWERELGTEDTVDATEWAATLASPVITSVTPGNQTLSVGFTAPAALELGFGPINYEYSLDNGASWIPRSPTATGSPIIIGALVNGTTYTIRIRAINAAGAGAASAPATGTPISSTLLAPTNLAATVTGNNVTLTWTLPAGSLAPGGYVVEGGVLPGQTLANLPTGSTATSFTFTAPTGTFYVRVHAELGSTRSAASNEIRILVNVPPLPNSPESLTGTAVGSTLTLQWRNNRDAGLPDGIVLNVSGAISASVNLAGNASSFSFVGVPPGTYTFSVRAVNISGSSAPSNSITLTFPGGCPLPGPPATLTATVAGAVVMLNWTAPTGAAPTSYVIEAGTSSGQANLAIVNTGSTSTTFSTPAPPGTYFVRVRAANACGTSGPSPDAMVVVP